MNKTLMTALAALILSGSAFAVPMKVKESDSKNVCAKIKTSKAKISVKFKGDADPKLVKLLKNNDFKPKGPGKSEWHAEMTLPTSGGEVVSHKVLIGCKKKFSDMKLGDLRDIKDAQSHFEALEKITDAGNDDKDLHKFMKLHHFLSGEEDVITDVSTS